MDNFTHMLTNLQFSGTRHLSSDTFSFEFPFMLFLLLSWFICFAPSHLHICACVHTHMHIHLKIDPTCLCEMMSPPWHDVWLRHSKNQSHCQYPAEGNDLKTRNCPRGLWGRCSSPLARETQAPHRLTRRARAPELERGNPPAVQEWQGTVK